MLSQEIEQARSIFSEALKSAIKAPGGVESLVEQGRTPIFRDSDKDQTLVTCFIPPLGVRKGDPCGFREGTFHYFSAVNLKPLGTADRCLLTAQEAGPLMERIKVAQNGT